MSFEPFTPPSNIAPQAGVKAALRKRSSAVPAKLVITLSLEAAVSAGLADGDKVSILMGQGNSHGMLRITCAGEGVLRLKKKNAWKRDFYVLNLGPVSHLVDRREKAAPCSWEVISGNTLEIVLPPWAEETNPNKPASAAEKAATARQAHKMAIAAARSAVPSEVHKVSR